jgi:hypothetical protein
VPREPEGAGPPGRLFATGIYRRGVRFTGYVVRVAVTTKLEPDLVDWIDGLAEAQGCSRSAVVESLIAERRQVEDPAELVVGEPSGPVAVAEFERARDAIRESNGPIVVGIPRLSLSHWLRDEAERLGVELPRSTPTSITASKSAPSAKEEPPTEEECRQMWGADRAYWPSNLQARYAR